MSETNAQSAAEPHVVTVRSTKPGRPVLRREQCTCSQDDAHDAYESPDEEES